MRLNVAQAVFEPAVLEMEPIAYTTTPQWIPRLHVVFSFYIFIETNLTVNKS